MPFCEKCGKEVADDAVFCTNCGAPIHGTEPVYRRPTSISWGAGRIAALFFGLILLAISFGFMVGGGGVMWASGSFGDDEGFLMSRDVGFSVDSYALVERGLDIDIDVNVPTILWAPNPGDFVTLKLEASSEDPAKEVFLGIASQSDASAYLGDVMYDEIGHFSWSYNPWSDSRPDISYSSHPGSAPSGPPVIHSFWVAHATGPGTQTLEWEPELGSYWIVAMNADGSSGVDVEARLGVKIPILHSIGVGLIVGGLVLLFVGGSLFWRGLYPR